jgi:hypothetical protein
MTKLCTTLGTTDTEIAAESATIDSNTTLVNDIRTNLLGNYCVSLPGLALGSSNADDILSAAFDYVIAGKLYHKATVETAPGTDAIVATKYGCVALDIDAAGTITAVPATGQVAAEFTSAALAIAALPAVASTKYRMGYVTVVKSDGTFTFSTTEFSAANVTDVFVDNNDYLSGIGSASS